MNDYCRKAFEEISIPNFVCDELLEEAKERSSSGLYKDDNIEQHWDTFQEGWEAALNYIKRKQNAFYSDIVSDGGMDMRERP